MPTLGEPTPQPPSGWSWEFALQYERGQWTMMDTLERRRFPYLINLDQHNARYVSWRITPLVAH
jgi:hypothetical protein